MGVGSGMSSRARSSSLDRNNSSAPSSLFILVSLISDLEQGGHQPKISGGPRSRYKVQKRWSTLQRWSIRGGKKVARRGHRWSETGTAVSDGHPDLEHRGWGTTKEPKVKVWVWVRGGFRV